LPEFVYSVESIFQGEKGFGKRTTEPKLKGATKSFVKNVGEQNVNQNSKKHIGKTWNMTKKRIKKARRADIVRATQFSGFLLWL
jgi:hypothetical protein